MQEKILSGKEFAGTAIQKINGELEFYFSTKGEKKLTLYNKNGLYNYKFRAINKVVQEIFLPFPVETIERTFDDIIKIIHYCFSVNIYCGQSTKGQSDEIYRRIDCTIVVTENNIYVNCKKLKKLLQLIQCKILSKVNFTKTIHSSKEILIEKINKKQLIIKEQKKLINNLKKYLIEKIEKEEAVASDEITNIIHTVSEKVVNKCIDISNLHPIFQELIRIQTEKSKETRYHSMFLRWTISIYSRSDLAAYNTMKIIMRLPSISILKSYIGKYEQSTGWQDKITYQLLSNLTINNIWEYERIRFFSHDSFKIQKDEMNEYQEFALQCQSEIESITSLSNSKLECIGICTLGSICDSVEENRTHIKSFDWYASK
ncbi:hypothetical protein Glove_102g95 [Diversispora epigaea]|uniref:Uncharacterized protein n=1 Tax=Diversispora epigaea TaxID=1348612 RepID=A0A397J3S5_9GLOM|nr:hypothetical protein Glove_102g95 [Diversispora epigaea]